MPKSTAIYAKTGPFEPKHFRGFVYYPGLRMSEPTTASPNQSQGGMIGAVSCARKGLGR